MQELQDSRTDSAKSISFLSGQLSVLTQLASNPPRNPDFASMARALGVLSKNPGNMRAETNLELQADARDLAKRLRTFQLTIREASERSSQEHMRKVMAARGNEQEMHKLQDEFTAQYMNEHNRNAVEFGPMRAECLALRQKILRKLPTLPNESDRQQQYGMQVIMTGMLAGPAPVEEAATYIESLAQLLPTKQ
jgi:hypothetical protein